MLRNKIRRNGLGLGIQLFRAVRGRNNDKSDNADEDKRFTWRN